MRGIDVIYRCEEWLKKAVAAEHLCGCYELAQLLQSDKNGDRSKMRDAAAYQTGLLAYNPIAYRPIAYWP